MSNTRIEKMNELLQHEIASFYAKIKIQDLIITIIEVETSKDLENATVWYSAIGLQKQETNAVKEESLKILNTHKKNLSENLIKKLDLRKIPIIHFKYDERSEYGIKIDKVLDSL
jgi:ribosome-binding factor A